MKNSKINFKELYLWYLNVYGTDGYIREDSLYFKSIKNKNEIAESSDGNKYEYNNKESKSDKRKK